MTNFTQVEPYDVIHSQVNFEPQKQQFHMVHPNAELLTLVSPVASVGAGAFQDLILQLPILAKVSRHPQEPGKPFSSKAGRTKVSSPTGCRRNLLLQ